jgi:hypothetical protein
MLSFLVIKERAVGPEAEELALPGFVDRADTVDNPEGSDRDRTCRWGGHGYHVHDLFLPSLDDQDPWALTQSYGVGLVLIREGSQGRVGKADFGVSLKCHPTIKAKSNQQSSGDGPKAKAISNKR